MIKGVVVQYVQRWRDLAERAQVSHAAIRLGKDSLNKGKSYIKEIKFLCSYIATAKDVELFSNFDSTLGSLLLVERLRNRMLEILSENIVGILIVHYFYC